MPHSNFHNPTSIALVAMFFLLMLGNVVTMHYVGLLSRDVMESKETLIRTSFDIEKVKANIESIETSLINRNTPAQGNGYANN
jgi:hypothetical protein